MQLWLAHGQTSWQISQENIAKQTDPGSTGPQGTLGNLGIFGIFGDLFEYF